MILAKSDGTTLQEHIEDCLRIAEGLKRSIPLLFKDFDFYNFLILAILFHDFGKLHPEFQKVLTKEKNIWELQRHEIYSVIFSNKIKLNEKDKELLQKAILAHHKSFDEIMEKHLSKKELEEDFDDIWRVRGYQFHPKDVLKNLSKFKLPDLYEIIDFIKSSLKKREVNFQIRRIKYSEQKHPVEELIFHHIEYEANSEDFFKHLLFSGSLKMCDHYGSAKITSIPNLKPNDLDFWDNNYKPFKHQLDCWNSRQNTILIAPTGSGKTECALGWLKKSLQSSMGKTFYILPYTASINAMHKRFCRDIEQSEPIKAKLIGIQHGKVEQYLNQYIENDYEFLKEKSDSFKKLLHPFKLTTPFQILKYFFGVKTFEIGFVNLYGAKIIFDEIHAYDVITFAQIIVVIEFLSKYFNCSVFIMTATLPTFLRLEIEKVIQSASLITPAIDFLENIKRHKVSIYSGNVFEAIEELESQISSTNQIMIVLNTVNQAQKCYQQIKETFPDEEMSLIHSRFTAKDRNRNEKKAFDKNTKFLIGTQAIEVSLNIDYDLLISDPAPLDALLQRFGRVNRSGKKAPAPIYVCKESSGNDSKIYPKEIVEKTLNALLDVHILRESAVQTLIDKVYPDWLPEQKKEFEDTKILFKSSLESLQPYSKNKEREEDFYDKFDGIKVLPAKFYAEYKTHIEEARFIEADELMVSLHKSTFKGLMFHKEGSRIIKDRFSIIKNDSIKNSDVLIAKCKYSSEKGLLTNDYQAIEDNDDNFL